MADDALTPLGALIEAARVRMGISKREAAKRAGISEGRWRQVVSGVQKVGGTTIPAFPRDVTVAAMASAVGVDTGEALRAAGFDGSEPVPVGQRIPREIAYLIDVFAQLPDEERPDFLRFVEMLAEMGAAKVAKAQTRRPSTD